MSTQEQQTQKQPNQPLKKSQISRKHIRKSRFVLSSQSNTSASSSQKSSKSTISSIRHTSKDFICPICLQMICCSATLKCGHAFCENCLIEFSLLFNTCLVCNDSILNQQYRNCFLLDNLIEEYIKVHFPDELQSFLARKEDSLKSRQLRGITAPKIGQKIDVRDTHNIWCQGIISRLAHDNEQVVQAITVAFLSGTHVQEQLPVDSARLAPEGVFTNRLDIPHYESLKSDAKVVIVKADKLGKQNTYYLS